MAQAFIVTAIAGADDPHRNILAGDRIYADATEWRGTLARSTWHATRMEAVWTISGSAWDRQTIAFLQNDRIRAEQIEVLELRYETVITSITTEERDSIIREAALKRLSPEERRVLGL